MRITAFIGAALIALCSLAMAPVAMADPAPDICVLDLTQAVAVDHAVANADLTCAALGLVADVRVDPDSPPGANGAVLQSACSLDRLAHLDFAGHRLHEDPGRCTV